MTDAPPVTAQPEDHVDCTQILGDVEAYEGPTQLNEEEEEEETPAVPRQTPSGTAGPPPRDERAAACRARACACVAICFGTRMFVVETLEIGKV